MRIVRQLVAQLFIVMSSVWATASWLIDWIGRTLVIKELSQTAPEWIVMLVSILSQTPWWVPMVLLVAAFSWLVWYDLRTLNKIDNRTIDGGTF